MHTVTLNIHGFKAVINLSVKEYFYVQYVLSNWTIETLLRYTGEREIDDNLKNRVVALLDSEYIVSIDSRGKWFEK